MVSEPTIRWNESAGRWMAWVRFPDGSRRKVERVDNGSKCATRRRVSLPDVSADT